MAVADKLSALRIKANLIADRNVGLMEISIEVHDGVAILRGEVETEQQKMIAEERAYEVEGIEEVQNEIVVIPPSEREDEVEAASAHLGYGLVEGDVGDTAFSIAGEMAGPGPGLASSEQFPGEFTDDEIEREVRNKLAEQDQIDVSGTRFWVINQIVHMKGMVDTVDDLNALQDMILNVRGVMGIRSEVSVQEGEIGTPSE